ncbi:hypothetical protein E2C01_073885 [Portunus trituberculatus]|uniref:Uncharacterized protein n=1 Tax=Portunus trituberculatus TaxID=210409 RepID=A0A5B7I1X5_PORTR|nr:hypothetical protein [Portunus trituberculatus]
MDSKVPCFSCRQRYYYSCYNLTRHCVLCYRYHYDDCLYYYYCYYYYYYYYYYYEERKPASHGDGRIALVGIW